MDAKIEIIRDIVPLEVPNYLHLLTGHYFVQGTRYCARRQRGTADWLLIATLSGSGRFGSGPQRFAVQERDVVMIRPGTAHDYGITPDAGHWDLFWVHFHPRPHWHDWLAWPETATPGVMRLRLNDDAVWKEARTYFRRTHRCATGAEPLAQDRAMNGLESLLLACQGELHQRASRLDERIQEVLQLISSKLAEPMSVQTLAEAVALSPSRLSHLFRDQVGRSPMQYLELQRIERSRHLLERTTSSISYVAGEVGMEPIHFSLRFKQHTGLSPREYRKQTTRVP